MILINLKIPRDLIWLLMSGAYLSQMILLTIRGMLLTFGGLIIINIIQSMQVAYFNFTKVSLTFRTDKLNLFHQGIIYQIWWCTFTTDKYIPAKLLHEKVNSIIESSLVNLPPKDFWPPAWCPPAWYWPHPAKWGPRQFFFVTPLQVFSTCPCYILL